MDIINELKNLEYKGNVIEDIKREKEPLAIWGCGEFADEVYSYLIRNDIEIDEVFVDDEYYFGNQYLKEKKVISCSELEKKYEALNVILGCSNYEKRAQLEKRKYIRKVFYLFSVNYGIFDKTSINYIHEHKKEFERTYELFEDDLSKMNFIAFLKTRLTGNNIYIEKVCEKQFNFYNNDIFQVGTDETYIDVGAYDGDTIKLFLNENNGKYKFIYALEPDNSSYHKLQGFIQENKMKNVFITKSGAWNRKGKLGFSLLNGQISSVVVQDGKEEANEIIEVNSLDNMFEYDDKVTLIKINYLKGVKEAIEGARNLLNKDCPKLAITVGFDCQNIRDIPILIKEINEKYKLYLRFNRSMVSALTLYAVVE